MKNWMIVDISPAIFCPDIPKCCDNSDHAK